MSGRPFVKENRLKNRLKNEVQMGRGLDVDFLLIFIDFGSQVGIENRRKVDSKGVEKMMEKGCGKDGSRVGS